MLATQARRLGELIPEHARELAQATRRRTTRVSQRGRRERNVSFTRVRRPCPGNEGKRKPSVPQHEPLISCFDIAARENAVWDLQAPGPWRHPAFSSAHQLCSGDGRSNCCPLRSAPPLRFSVLGKIHYALRALLAVASNVYLRGN